ncbi:MAG: hypothetical protein Q9195_006159 [Heterodermia aff. obscurata]
MTERQAVEEVRVWKQPSTLHFINVEVVSPPGHLTVRNAEEERSIRAHVMKDYLRQKGQILQPGKTLAAVPKLSDHLIRFRLPARQSRKRSRRGTKEAGLVSVRTKMRDIVSRDHQTLREAVLAKSLADEVLHGVHSLIDISTPGTLALLEYYHTSYWDNSLAVNPEGQWLSVAISDAAMLHATLCLVALHKDQMHGVPPTNPYFWHRGEAMRLILKNLADPAHAICDATLAAVAILSASDNSTHLPSITQTSHIQGLIKLVKLRGGIDGMTINRHIQRVVAWADILHAIAHNCPPQLEMVRYIADHDTKTLMDVVKGYGHVKVAWQSLVPICVQKVWADLQALAVAKSLLSKNAVSNLQELRPIFSNFLFVTEYRILELGHRVAPSNSGLESVTLEAMQAAAFIFTFHGLRDIAITAAFFDSLIQRLRDGLCGVSGYGSTAQNSECISAGTVAAPFVLWLLLNGWKATAIKSRQRDRMFFVESAAMLCGNAKIDSLENLNSCVNRIIVLTEYYVLSCSGLWADIKTWSASHSI